MGFPLVKGEWCRVFLSRSSVFWDSGFEVKKRGLGFECFVGRSSLLLVVPSELWVILECFLHFYPTNRCGF